MAVTRGLAATSVFIARESGRRLDEDALPEELGVSVVTIGELRAGVLVAADPRTRDQRLATLQEALRTEPIPVDESVARAWARLRVELRDAGLRLPVNDSWIAATAIALDVPVVTQDDDYRGVPSLEIIRV
ncbi:MAG: type II toxin-antitoxin system VapC family toxin [Nitriliruptor sp.]|uniref:type II toxin-antitoxin system VapC family toxin n=1 Tax=Nitriliruptor sp. TaxID=2448056 RepID=UPI0034A032DC